MRFAPGQRKVQKRPYNAMNVYAASFYTLVCYLHVAFIASAKLVFWSKLVDGIVFCYTSGRQGAIWG